MLGLFDRLNMLQRLGVVVTALWLSVVPLVAAWGMTRGGLGFGPLWAIYLRWHALAVVVAWSAAGILGWSIRWIRAAQRNPH